MMKQSLANSMNPPIFGVGYLAFQLLFAGSSIAEPQKELIGLWKGSNHGETFFLYIYPGGKCTVSADMPTGWKVLESGSYAIKGNVLKTRFHIPNKVFFTIKGKKIKSEFFITSVSYRIKDKRLIAFESYFDVRSKGKTYRANYGNPFVNYVKMGALPWRH